MPRKRTSDNDLVVSTGANAAAARRTAAPRTRSKRAAEPAETATAAVTSEPQIAEPILAQPVEVAPLPEQEPSREQIATLAYLYWEARGCQGGSAEEDWLRAEQELRVRCSTAIA